jgi:anti-anti-sigma regulatory factor
VSYEIQLSWAKKDTVEVAGAMDEKSKLTDIFSKAPPVLYVDFGKVHRINSSGVRHWVQLVAQMDSIKIHYINCSPVIVEQISMVGEFLGKKGVVDSFRARYCCPKCVQLHELTLKVGKDIKAGQQRYEDGPEKRCPKCKSPMEFDHNPDSYLYFLTHA